MTESVTMLDKESTLFGISRALLACANGETVVDSETGEVFEQFDPNAMDALAERFEDKVTACMVVRNRKEADAAALKEMARRLNDRARVIESQTKSLERYVRDAMLSIGVDKVATDVCKVSIRKPSKHVEVIDPSAVPTEFVLIPEPKFDKRSIMAALKSGEDVPGCALVDGEHGLAVR